MKRIIDSEVEDVCLTKSARERESALHILNVKVTASVMIQCLILSWEHAKLMSS